MCIHEKVVNIIQNPCSRLFDAGHARIIEFHIILTWQSIADFVVPTFPNVKGANKRNFTYTQTQANKKLFFLAFCVQLSLNSRKGSNKKPRTSFIKTVKYLWAQRKVYFFKGISDKKNKNTEKLRFLL